MIQSVPSSVTTPVPTLPVVKPAESSVMRQSQNSAGPSDPLADLVASIATMREHIEKLQARLNDAGRRIREAILQQKQKERIYQETSRKLEKIRMAV